MYILIKDSEDLRRDIGHLLLAAAHASLSGYLTFIETDKNNGDYDPETWEYRTEQWARQSFRKVICKVTEDQFERAKLFGTDKVDYRVMTESFFDNAELAIVFKPIDPEDPAENRFVLEFLQSLPLYK